MPDTLCDSKDRVAGVMGHFLPLSDQALTDFALSQQAKQLIISFVSIEMPGAPLKEIPQKMGFL